MIVQRITVQYKPGKLQEAIALLKAERDRVTAPHAIRMYIPQSGAELGIAEYEFENSEEMEKFWVNWAAQPEAQAFLEKYNALTEGEMVTEYFNLF